jgi:beta-phosphoglucomutase-like phosphatase (HAD superfamily)
MDGTLSDSETLHWDAYRRVFARLVPNCEANPISREFYNTHMGGKTKVISMAPPRKLWVSQMLLRLDGDRS